MKSSKTVLRIICYICLSLCGGPIGLLAVLLYEGKRQLDIEKKRKVIYDKIRMGPTESNVQELIIYCQNNDFNDKPQHWNEIRGIWFIVNESPNISTETKYRFRDFLMTKGLRITGKDKEVIKNHK